MYGGPEGPKRNHKIKKQNDFIFTRKALVQNKSVFFGQQKRFRSQQKFLMCFGICGCLLVFVRDFYFGNLFLNL